MDSSARSPRAMIGRSIVRCAFALAYLRAILSPCFAQAPAIDAAMPVGVQRGATAAITVEGKNLTGAKLLIGGMGVRVESTEANVAGTGAVVKLAVARDAPLGPREIRVGTAKGVSNPARIWIDIFADREEAEPNDDAAHAQPLGDRTVISGRIQAPMDRDTFSFQAQAGDAWVFDCSAARIWSRLAAALELRDQAGQLVKMVTSTSEVDPRLIYRFAQAGRYFLTIRDQQLLGGPDYSYRLTVGTLPVVTSYLPHGEKPGRALDLLIQGVNLGGSTHGITAIPASTPPGEMWTTVQTARGPALPFSLLVDTNPVIGLTETDATMPLPTLPCSLDGIFQVYPRLRFMFEAATGDRFVFDLFGRRIGSSIDGALKITDSAGKEVAAASDTPGIGKDVRLDFTAPAAGIYTVELRNDESKVGPDCFYRLVARRAGPDFRLALNADRIQVAVGGNLSVQIALERLNGFDGPVKLSADDLPLGVTFGGGEIAAGQTSIEVRFNAAANAATGATAIHIRGSAQIAGRAVTRQAPAREPYMPRSTEPNAAPGGDSTSYRICDLLPLAVIDRAGP